MAVFCRWRTLASWHVKFGDLWNAPSEFALLNYKETSAWDDPGKKNENTLYFKALRLASYVHVAVDDWTPAWRLPVEVGSLSYYS